MKIYLYGAGYHAFALRKSIEAEQNKTDFEVVAILDKYQVGKKEGVDIISPTANSQQPTANSLDFNLPVFITIKGYSGIVEYLQSLGFKNIYDIEETFKYFPKSLQYLSEDGFVWRVKDMTKKHNPERVELLKNILEDDYSVKTLNRIINYRLHPCAETYMEPESYTMYFPNNVPSIYGGSELNIVDCGAYDGDSALDFFKRYPAKINRYLAIEPELKNALKLRENLKDYSEKISVIEKGLAAKSGSFQIQSSGSASSLVTKTEGNIDSQVVEVVTLPSILEAESTIFNLIKTDIEGFDREVIQSVLPYIEKYLPTLAISIYHNPDDLWEIPLDIHSAIGDKYAYYIRHEGHWGSETILYCVPKS